MGYGKRRVQFLTPALFLLVCLFTTAVEAKFSVRRGDNMNFGTIASSVEGSGTATISTGSDTKTITGSIFDFGGTVARARFTVSGGTPSGLVTITLPASFTISKSGVTLTVDNLATDVANPAQLDGSGKLTFYVGGRLSVPTNQAPQSGLGGDLIVDVLDQTSTDSDGASATASAAIVAPIAVSETTSLNFGHLSPSSFSGTLTVSTSGTTTSTNITELPGVAVSQGVFSVTGDGGAAFGITLPRSATLSNGANTMTVNGFNHDAGAAPSLGGGGSREVNVGATLNVGANQAGGSYTGSYSITVNYN